MSGIVGGGGLVGVPAGCASSCYDRRRRIEDIGSRIRSGGLSTVITDNMFNALCHMIIVDI